MAVVDLCYYYEYEEAGAAVAFDPHRRALFEEQDDYRDSAGVTEILGQAM